MKCPAETELIARLDGELTQNEIATIDAHVATCSSCRARLMRLQAITATLPEAVSSPRADAAFTSDVMARIENKVTASSRVPWAFGFGAIASAVLVIVSIASRVQPTVPDVASFQMRGGSSGAPLVGFSAVIHPASQTSPQRPLQANETVRPGDGFSFEVFNRSTTPRFMALFAIDSHGETHWFYPPVTREGDDPEMVQVPSSPGVMALAEGVTPEDVSPGPLRIIGIFLDQPKRVSFLEEAARHGTLDSLEGAHVDTTVVTAAPEPRP